MTNCPKCGKNLELVGKVHNCAVNKCDNAANKEEVAANEAVYKLGGEIIPPSYVKSRFRDINKRRRYMRGYMAKRRALPPS